MPDWLYTILKNTQDLLHLYINARDGEENKYEEDLSRAVRDLVHKAASKRETSDLEDFEEDCVLAIWTKVVQLREDEESSAIENIEAFIRQAVHNRYCDAIRRKRPKWYNLKLELNEIFSGKAGIQGFALWQSSTTGERLCGYSIWQGDPNADSVKCREAVEKSDVFRRKYLDNREPQELATYQLAAAILDFVGAPVGIDALTNCVAQLTDAKNPEPLSIDAQPDEDSEGGAPVDWLVSKDALVEDQVMDSSWFAHVLDWFWKEFCELSVKQKKAVLFGMGADQVMAISAVVGMQAVADTIEMDKTEFAKLVKDLPVPDADTAKLLAIETKAVPSVRFKAWGRIRRRTKKSSLVIDDE